MRLKRIFLYFLTFVLTISTKYSYASSYNETYQLNIPVNNSKKFSLKLKVRIKITGFKDFENNNWLTGDSDIEDINDLCVYTNSSFGYKVLATSQNLGFNLRSSEIDNDYNLPYSLQWLVNENSTDLLYNNPSQTFTNASKNSVSCNGKTNSALKLKILASDLQEAPSSELAYIDILTISVLPI